MNPPFMEATTDAREPGAPAPPGVATPTILPGDRLIVGIWLAMALTVGRAALQAMVDWTAGGETGALLGEHFIEHVLEATGRTWLILLPVALLPRGRAWPVALARALVAFGVSAALLSGWPDGEARYLPGFDSTRGLQGWGVIAFVSLLVVAADRYATSPRRGFFRWSPATRFVVTSAVLLLGGAGVATGVHLVEERRRYIEMESLVADLLDTLPDARLTAGAGGALPVVGSIQAARGEASAAGNQPSLVVPVGGAYELEIDLPRHASLRVGLAIDSASVRQRAPLEQRLTFVIAIDGAEERVHTIAPQERPEDRAWFDLELPLTTTVERRARISLAVRGEGPEIERVQAGFGRPRLVRREWRLRAGSEPGRMNVVLAVVDSLRPDHLRFHGYGRETSPNLDRLAQESIVFERARAPSTWVWPVAASLHTGLWPPTHNVVDVDRCFLADSHVTLAEALAQNGCTTLGASADPLISDSKNFHQGFADWRPFPLAPAARLAEQFGEWVRRYRGYQFFACLHLFDPHRPYNPPERFATRFASAEHATEMRRAVNALREQRSHRPDPARGILPVEAEADARPRLPEQAFVDLYDGEIAAVDAQIGRMLALLEDSGLLDRTLVIVTGCGGERVSGEAPAPAGVSLDPELRWVPLLIRDPRHAPARVSEVVDQTFLAGTILAAMGTTRVAGGPPPVAYPPWGGSQPRAAFFHTARARVEGSSEPCERIGIEVDDFVITMRVDGGDAQVEDRRPEPQRGRDATEVVERLKSRLKEWYDTCRKDAFARPFERTDGATRFALDQTFQSGGSR